MNKGRYEIIEGRICDGEFPIALDEVVSMLEAANQPWGDDDSPAPRCPGCREPCRKCDERFGELLPRKRRRWTQ